MWNICVLHSVQGSIINDGWDESAKSLELVVHSLKAAMGILTVASEKGNEKYYQFLMTALCWKSK